jgi:hypothetical protein
MTPTSPFIKKISSLDAFPKVESGYKERSSSGGAATLFVCIVLSFLLLAEFNNWLSIKQTYHVAVDNVVGWGRHGLEGTGNDNWGSTIDINLDMTVATACECKKEYLIFTQYFSDMEL